MSNEPAFPQEAGNTQRGLTMRDYFAAKALQGILAGFDRDAERFIEAQNEPLETMALACYKMADAMMVERGKK